MRSRFSAVRGWFLLLSFCLASAAPAEPVPALATETPRTRTLPGIASPAFPYAQPEEVGLSSEKLNRLGDEVAAWTANGDLVGAELLIIKDRKTVFHEAYGWSDREARRPMRRNSVFSIKSMSKPFTSMAVLMLVEEGKLSLRDPVKKFIDSYPDPRATVRHLLVQTTGYSGDIGKGGEHYKFDSLREWIENWAAEGPTEPFGEFSYSDFNYGALGHIVAEVSGMSLEEFTERRIIEPIGLTDTITRTASDRAGTTLPISRGEADCSTADYSDWRWRERLNPWYKWNTETNRYDLRWTTKLPGWGYYPAAWGLFSTAMDYATFMYGWLDKGVWSGKRLLSEKTVEEALRAHSQGTFYDYGYGWAVDEAPVKDGMPSSFWHGGGDGTIAIAFPATESLVVFLTHSRGGTHISALPHLLSINAVFDHPGVSYVWTDASAPTISLSDEQKRLYVGEYVAEWAGERLPLTVSLVDGGLRFRVGRYGRMAPYMIHDLVPLGENIFAVGRYELARPIAIDLRRRIRFHVDEHGANRLQFLSGEEEVFAGERITTSN